MRASIRTGCLLLLLAGAGIGLCTAAPPKNKELDALVGKPFSQARATLVASGWAPVETDLTIANGERERSRGEAAKFESAGFPEIERCTGGERNYCFLNYSRRGKCLRVRTVGALDLPGSDPKVHGVGDACPSKQRAAR